ncbi:MAG: hypothetical protein V2I43_05745, partial [Parvularcula sp.]|nr:hypothetical protein [Parvularcula sp.]
MTSPRSAPMRILHIALQGCLKAGSIDYGLTPDTGGHIRYVMELCAANERAGVEEQIIVTRGFDEPSLGEIYAQHEEQVSARTRIIRLNGSSSRYLTKEQISREIDTLTDRFLSLIENLPQKPDIIHAHYADAGRLAIA